jgi:hypothetical protein
MEPTTTVEFAVRFAAALSAWWLVLLAPVVAALCVVVYRRQSRSIDRRHAWGLTALRVFVLVAVVVLAFRPSLVRRHIATYKGRLLVVLDDSASMAVKDPELPEGEATTIARTALDSYAGREAPIAELRRQLLVAERELIRFDRYGRSADRTLDAFWSEADRVQAVVGEQLGAIVERATDLAGGSGDVAGLQDVADLCGTLQAFLGPLFAGNDHPAPEFGAEMRLTLSELADRLAAIQERSELAAASAGDAAVKGAIDTVRGSPRLDLAYAWLAKHRDELLEGADDLSVYLQPLSQPDPVRLAEIGDAAPSISKVETDLSGRLLHWIEEEHPFPLAGIVLISDGRNLGDTPVDRVTQAAGLRSVPIHCAAVGGSEEPPDVAVRDLYYPPFAVAGAEIGVLTSLKTVLPKPGKVKLELLNAEQVVVTNMTIEIAEQVAVKRRPVFTSDEEGLQRLTIRAGDVAGEVVPGVNNSRDVMVRVRQDPVRVLFLDWKPRWQSRFILNILNRLDYLDVNSIIGIVQPDGKPKRGVGKGSWPEDAGILALYDLVIIGDLPQDLLTAEEWQHLSGYVEEGGSLVFLGTGRTDPVPEAAQSLLPTQPRKEETVLPADVATFQLTSAGLHHPVTRSLKSLLEASESVVEARRLADTMVLLQSSDGHPLITARFVGEGKTMLIDNDDLWRRLNAHALNAHSALAAGIADWAVEARRPVDQPQPDLYRYSTRESVQLWTVPDGSTNQTVELAAGERVLTARAVPPHPGSMLAAAVFGQLPPGDWSIRKQNGETAAEQLLVVDRSRELHDLSRDERWLKTLAKDTGGSVIEFTDAGRLLNDIRPRSRIERLERVWRLWDSVWVLGFLVLSLTVEWIWRKLAGLA